MAPPRLPQIERKREKKKRRREREHHQGKPWYLPLSVDTSALIDFHSFMAFTSLACSFCGTLEKKCGISCWLKNIYYNLLSRNCPKYLNYFTNCSTFFQKQ